MIPKFIAGLMIGSLPGSLLGHHLDVTMIRRDTNMLMNIPGRPPLPQPNQVSKDINIDNIQSEVMLGMRLSMEEFSFFTILDPDAFKRQMSGAVSQITTVSSMLDTSTQPHALMNMGFSQRGLTILGIQDNVNDTDFTTGQFSNAPALAERTDNWVPQFKGNGVHGVLMVASDSQNLLTAQSQSIKNRLGRSINITYSIQGQARPGDQAGHEHFGFLDGISQPLPQGFGPPVPGQQVVPTGTVLHGNDQDNMTRPMWMKDSSFLVFRQLKQMVPEFHKFASDNAASIPGMPKEQAAALTAARMVGRWPSGAPVYLAPVFDDPVLGSDPNRNNDFNYTHPGLNSSDDQSRCPFSAHIRKTAPRADLSPIDVKHHVIRGGIPYGDEVTPQEQQQGRTLKDRGLLFTCTQSNIAVGFQFLQKAWIGNPSFVGDKNVQPGFDPILGQNNDSALFTVGIDLMNPLKNFSIPQQFVMSRGGEYFFVPSISAMKHIINMNS